MKSFLIFLFILCPMNSYSQTWTERDTVNKTDIEYTALTKEQFDRLERQSEERYNFAVIEYTDVMEQGTPLRVISGTRPATRGYYYQTAKYIPHSDMPEEERAILAGFSNVLIYGNTNTGQMEIIFTNSTLVAMGMALVGKIFNLRTSSGWNEYAEQYNMFLRWVNGE